MLLYKSQKNKLNIVLHHRYTKNCFHNLIFLTYLLYKAILIQRWLDIIAIKTYCYHSFFLTQLL